MITLVFYGESSVDVSDEVCLKSSFAIALTTARPLLLRSNSSALTYRAPLGVTYILGRSASVPGGSFDDFSGMSTSSFEFRSTSILKMGV